MANLAAITMPNTDNADVVLAVIAWNIVQSAIPQSQSGGGEPQLRRMTNHFIEVYAALKAGEKLNDSEADN